MRNVIRYIFLIINIVFVALLLMSAIVRLFHNEPPWVFELVSLGYPYYMGVNCAFLLFWLIMKKFRYALVLLVAMALTYSPFLDTFAFGNERKIQENDETLRVVTYNVNAFNYWGWRERPTIQAEVFSLLKQSQPDVICFQEYHHDRQEKYQLMDSIKQQLGLKYVAIQKLHYVKNRYFYGTVIFSRYPIVQKGTLDFGKSGNSSQWVDIVRGGDTIRIYNNHLESYRLQSRNYETIEQVASGENFEVEEVKNVLQKMVRAIQTRNAQAILLTKSVHDCPHKALVCGDFNAPAYSFTYHIIRETNNLRDAFLETSRGAGGTYHWKFLSKRIDFILMHPDFTPASSKVHRLKISDHFPVEAEIIVP